MAAPKPQEIPLQSPIRLLDALFILDDQAKGGTPMPSKARMLFVSGMQALSVGKIETARERLVEALEDVRRAVPLRKEEVAVCQLGVGYLDAVSPAATRDLAAAARMYSEAADMLEQAAGVGCPQVAPLVADLAVVYQMGGKKEEATRELARARAMLDTAMEPRRGQTPEHHRRTCAGLYAQVAQAHAASGDLANAVPLMAQAVAAMEKFGDPSLKAAQVVLRSLQQQLQQRQ
eukprot:m51a1_g4684 hypothetical protein (233) ;mRNA; f:172075-173305